jgi:hypothetical protein
MQLLYGICYNLIISVFRKGMACYVAREPVVYRYFSRRKCNSAGGAANSPLR